MPEVFFQSHFRNFILLGPPYNPWTSRIIQFHFTNEIYHSMRLSSKSQNCLVVNQDWNLYLSNSKSCLGSTLVTYTKAATVWVLWVSLGQQTWAFLWAGLEGRLETTRSERAGPGNTHPVWFWVQAVADLRQELLGNAPAPDVWWSLKLLWTVDSAPPRTVTSMLGVHQYVGSLKGRGF